jgi:predicted flap endonuclease-1-like 5' DNA nuclease
MTSVRAIEGIGEVYSKRLHEIGISTVEALLENGASPQGRQTLAEQSQISRKLILKWVNRADLNRIKGVAEEYADLLETAGVDTVPELAQRNPENLLQAMINAGQKRNLVRKMPALSQVQDWIDQAKQLPRVVTY